MSPPNPIVTDVRGNSFELRPLDCPTCRTPARTVLGLRGGEHHRYGLGIATVIKRCDGCGLIFPDPFPYPLDAQRLYADPDKYFERHDAVARLASYRQILRELTSMAGAGPSPAILDIGSGRGELLQAARLEGLDDVVGLELSKAMIDRVAAELGFAVFAETIEEHARTAGRRYDIFVLSAVLEHLYDPDAAIEAVAALAHPRSVLWVDVPNEPNLLTIVGNALCRARGSATVYNLAPTFPPYHVFGFNRRSLAVLLAKHGFFIERYLLAGWSEVPARGGGADRAKSFVATQVNRVGMRVGMAPNLTVWARFRPDGHGPARPT
jgi:SAM-dependent methyltransferase